MKTMFRNRRYFNGPGYGRGQGYGQGMGRGFGRGLGPGRRFSSPNCDFFPDRPRGWWTMPQYQEPVPKNAIWNNKSGEPQNNEAITYEIQMIEKEMEEMKKEIEHLKSLKSN